MAEASQKIAHKLAKSFKRKAGNRSPSPAELVMYDERRVPVINLDSDEEGTEIDSQEWDDPDFKKKTAEERASILLYIDYDVVIQMGLKDRYLNALRGFKADRIAKNRWLDIKDPNTVINQRLVSFVRGCFLNEKADQRDSAADDRIQLLEIVCKPPYPTSLGTKHGVILYTCSRSFHVRDMLCRNGLYTRFAPDLLCAYIQYLEDFENYKDRLSDIKPNQEHDREDKRMAAIQYTIVDTLEYKIQ